MDQSVSAILDGKSVNSSMGFTPLAGVVMGTRCGDIDPEIIPFLEEELNIDSHEMRRIMNEDSGLKGLSGISNDEREIESAAKNGNERAQLALDVFVHSIQQYIGAYTTDLDGLDTLYLQPELVNMLLILEVRSVKFRLSWSPKLTKRKIK